MDNKIINAIEKLIRAGLDKEKINETIQNDEFDELFSIAKARIHNKKIENNNLIFNEEDLRFATNSLVAKYRAKRLKCKTLLEIGAGIGIQTIEFAKTCDKVIAIEKDKRKFNYLKLNLEIANVKNVELINKDVFKVIDELGFDNVFCDPEREESEKERTIESIKPNLEKLTGKIQDISIELPPQIKLIPFECEKEYVSVDGRLNRLNVYLGKLKKNKISVIALPSEEMLTKEDEDFVKEKGHVRNYMYEIDKAVVKASLQRKINADGSMVTDEWITSEDNIESPFFLNRFKVIDHCEYDDEKIIEILKKNKIGKTVIRAKLKPQEYWDFRKKYESKIKGQRIAHLLFLKGNVVILEKI
ncbi:MAG TPA: rRNA adenine N-6-methyltransferase family protein [Candidatus Nanoarchaeia archaeon]|nr:rRNA adenine N-6-methyltransferase family protein [Candidatus Nanoarchaeia archaeon]